MIQPFSSNFKIKTSSICQMDNYDLSEGALEIIINGGEVANPIVQILGTKKVNAVHWDRERYRIFLSDGQHSISFAIFTIQKNNQMVDGLLENYSVVKLKRYITSLVNNADKPDTRILLILDMELVTRGEYIQKTIGAPIQITDHNTTNKSWTPVSTCEKKSPTKATYTPSSIISTNRTIAPLASINPYHNNWVIKVRIFSKSNIRTWANSRGEGQLFSMDMVDESGEMRCTAFRELVDRFYDYIQIDGIYYISKGVLKHANKEYCKLQNEYEMTLTSDSIIEKCEENDEKIPLMKFEFTPIDQIAFLGAGDLIDVVGICQSSSDLQTLHLKSSNREAKKREIVLFDQSKNSIVLNLWGTDAESFVGTHNPVVAVKGVRVDQFGGGKSLSFVMNSRIKLNPNLPEARSLEAWYLMEGGRCEITSISGSSGLNNLPAPWMSLREALDLGLGDANWGEYYQVFGTILSVRTDNCIYKACPAEKCNKKVINLENGMYRCEKCNREYPKFEYRLLISMNIADNFSNQWVTGFSSEAEKIFGMTSEEAGLALEEDPEALMQIAASTSFKQFVFKCRTKREFYNDDDRLKTVIVRANKINYKEYNSFLVSKIQEQIS